MNATKHSRPADPAAAAAAAREADARDLKILKGRLWHFTSIGMGNCRAAQKVSSEIEQRQQAQTPTRTQSPNETPPQYVLANQSVEQLTAGLSHLVSVGLANSRAAKKISYELGRRLIEIASLTNDDNFNPNEPRDQDGKWTIGSNASGSHTNTPTQTAAPGSAPAQKDDDDDTDNIPLTYGGAHAKLRQSASDGSAQLYNKGRGDMKGLAAVGRAAAEMNPIVAFFNGIYQALVGKDAIDPNKHLTTAERWKSAGSAAMAVAPTGLKAAAVAKDVVEAGEAAQALRKADNAIIEAGEIKKAEGAIAKAEQTGHEVKKAEEAGAGAAKAAKDTKDPIHHIATNKNWVSTARGGPWSPRLDALFQKAGMTLEDGMNKLSLPGHFGPHPEAYHAAVFKRLKDATEGLSGADYTKAFKAALSKLADEVNTPGTELNKLLTE
jgi:hypothetical protein